MSTNETSIRETLIEAVEGLPSIRIERDFDAGREQVFRAWTAPELVVRWLGPHELEMRLDSWDCHTGGHYRYSHYQGGSGELVATFYGSFHEVRTPERLVQTFTYVDLPDAVSLEIATFTELDERRTRVRSLAIVDTLESRDAMLASGMEVGLRESYEKLDALLTA